MKKANLPQASLGVGSLGLRSAASKTMCLSGRSLRAYWPARRRTRSRRMRQVNWCSRSVREMIHAAATVTQLSRGCSSDLVWLMASKLVGARAAVVDHWSSGPSGRATGKALASLALQWEGLQAGQTVICKHCRPLPWRTAHTDICTPTTMSELGNKTVSCDIPGLGPHQLPKTREYRCDHLLAQIRSRPSGRIPARCSR